jgi:hypothetical protein
MKGFGVELAPRFAELPGQLIRCFEQGIGKRDRVLHALRHNRFHTGVQARLSAA